MKCKHNHIKSVQVLTDFTQNMFTYNRKSKQKKKVADNKLNITHVAYTNTLKLP